MGSFRASVKALETRVKLGCGRIRKNLYNEKVSLAKQKLWDCPGEKKAPKQALLSFLARGRVILFYQLVLEGS